MKIFASIAVHKESRLSGGRKEQNMERAQTKEILGKQLQLLSERSQGTKSPEDLAAISHAMCEIAKLLGGINLLSS